MTKIVKICKLHGELTIDKAIKEKRKSSISGFAYRCKECRCPSKLAFKKEIKKRCEIHGVLEKENIRIKYGLLICRLCQIEERKKYKQNNREKILARERGYYQKNIDKERIRSKLKYRKFKKRAMEGYIKNAYGLSAEEYWTMVKDQENKCKICGNEETRKQSSRSDEPGKICRLAIDHCHDTNKVRGLLCHRCNVGIGGLRHDIKLLKVAIKYLKPK